MLKNFAWAVGLVAVAVLNFYVPRLAAQDADDPPGRVARLAYLEGSVSFQPSGESEWVEAVPNRPMTTGDKLWADRDSRAEVQLGSAMIDLAPNTGFSFLNLDDRTIQIQLSTGSLNVRLWNMDRDNVFEIDTPNQAFTAFQPGRYRVEASENGDYTVITVREGEGESTGNGQSFTMRAGQRFTFSGTTSLNAEVDQIGGPDDFDNWSYRREQRYDDSPSARYCSRRVVGFEDLDDYGDWRPDRQYGNVWFPRVDSGWAPYHDGHWAWIDPWGWTWVDDARWGYAPFHYGRWANFGGRWGWVPGPREEHPVYAPALVAFVGGGFAAGATVAWFPLGPREVYVPSYHVSPAYVNRVNITNTTVNQTTITNVYNTTIINNNTTINNVTYVNRNVQGGVTAMPQQAFATAQPVARTAVAVNTRQMAGMSVVSRAAVSPSSQAVLGAHANTANRVAAPPAAVVNRAVIAKSTPPPPSPSFSARQQILQQHPGVSVPRAELAKMRPASGPAAPVVKQAPPGKPATPTPAMNRPTGPGGPPANPAGNAQPGNPPAANNHPQPTPPPARSEQPASTAPNYRPQPNPPTPANRPEPSPSPVNRPAQPTTQPATPPAAQPGYRPQPNPTTPANRPEPSPPAYRPVQPTTQPATPPAAQPGYRPQPNPPTSNQPTPNRAEPTPAQPGRPTPPPARTDRPPSPEPNYRAQPPQPAPNNRVEPNRPTPPPEQTNRPPSPPPNRQETAPPPNNRPEAPRTEQNHPAPPPARTDRPPSAQQQRPQPNPTPEEKKKQEEQKKDENRPQ